MLTTEQSEDPQAIPFLPSEKGQFCKCGAEPPMGKRPWVPKRRRDSSVRRPSVSGDQGRETPRQKLRKRADDRQSLQRQ